MRLIVGLGNPGAKYRDTLHNVGFAAVDALAESISDGIWAKGFDGYFLKGKVEDDGFLLLKPQTYMNASGRSVLACSRFYRLELRDMLVVSDDVDRPAGSLRYRESGGHGGHNGLRDIIRCCGEDFHRIKIGVGRPAAGSSVADYVLSEVPSDIRLSVESAVADTRRYLKDFIAGLPVRIRAEPDREQKCRKERSAKRP